MYLSVIPLFIYPSRDCLSFLSTIFFVFLSVGFLFIHHDFYLFIHNFYIFTRDFFMGFLVFKLKYIHSRGVTLSFLFLFSLFCIRYFFVLEKLYTGVQPDGA